MSKHKAVPRKLVIIGVVCLFLFGVVVFARDHFLGFAVRWIVQSQCRDHLGQPLAFDKLIVSNRSVILTNPVFMETTGDVAGGYRLTADQVVIDCTFQWKWHPLTIDVCLKQPQLLVVKRKEVLSCPHFDISGSLPPILANVSISGVDGTIQLQEETVSGITSSQFAINAEGHWSSLDRQARVTVQLGRDISDTESLALIVKYLSDKERFQVLSFETSDLQCADVIKWGRFFYHSLEGWEVTDGSLRGSVSIGIDDKRPAFVEGDLGIDGLVANNADMNLRGKLGKAQLELKKEGHCHRAYVGLLETYGFLRVEDDISIGFLGDEENAFWQVDGLSGEMIVRSLRDIDVGFTGQCIRYGETAELRIDGHVSVLGDARGAAVVGARIADKNGQQVAADLIAQYRDGGLTTEITLTDIGVPELRAFQAVLGARYPQWKQFHLYGGSVSALVRANFRGMHVGHVRVVQFLGDDLEVDVVPWGTYTRIGQIQGNMEADMSADHVFNSLNANLSIARGQAKVWGINSDFWHLTDVTTELLVREGVVQKSVIDANIAGLTGTIQCDWSSSHEVMKLHCHGNTQDLALLLPTSVRQGLHRSVGGDPVIVMAALKRHNESLLLEGKLQVSNGDNDSVDTVRFGCELDKILKGHCNEDVDRSYKMMFWQNDAEESSTVIIPRDREVGTTKESVNSKENKMDFAIKNGWFCGEGLLLSKYVSPFVFPDHDIKLSGIAHLEGVFDQRGIAIEYDAVNVILDSPIYHMTIPVIRSSERCSAFHYFDFKNDNHFGFIPIVDGSYLQKSTNLLFENVAAQVHIDGKIFHVTGIETTAEGVSFAGRVDVDNRSPVKGQYDVVIRTDHFSSDVSHFQKLLSHFGSFPLCKIPINGQIHSTDKNGFLSFAHTPSDCEIEVRFEGEIAEASSIGKKQDFALKDLKFTFAYDYGLRSLRTSGMKGNFIIDHGEQTSCFQVRCDRLDFTDINADVLEFDLCMCDDVGELARLTGVTSAELDENNHRQIRVTFDNERTHLAESRPSEITMVLDDWINIKDAHCSGYISDNPSLKRLAPIATAVRARLPLPQWQHLNERLTVRDFTFDVGCKDDGTSAYIEGNSDHVSFDGRPVDQCSFKCKKHDNIWMLEQLRFDDVTVAADVVRLPGCWKINFLGVEYGDNNLLGAEGEYRTNDKVLDLHINLLEVDFGKAQEFVTLPSFFQRHSLSGRMRATGSLLATLGDTTTCEEVKLLLSVAGKDIQMGEYRLRNFDDVTCSLADGVLTLESIETAFISSDSQHGESVVSIEKAAYNPSINETAIKNMRFSVPVENLDWIATTLHLTFPEAFGSTMATTMSNIQTQGNFQGGLDLELSPAFWSLQLALDERDYIFNDCVCDLRDYQLECDPFHLKVALQYRYRDQYYGLLVNATTPDAVENRRSGIVKLFDIDDNFRASSMLEWEQLEDRRPETLTARWYEDPTYGLCIDDVQGCFSGLEVDLTSTPEQGTSPVEQLLQGSIHFDGYKIVKLLPQDFATLVKEWQLRCGYSLEGELQISKNSWRDVRFEGLVHGRNFSVKGVILNELDAAVSYSPDEVILRNMTVSDPCGRLVVSSVVAVKDRSEHWFVSIPKLEVEDFRPSILHREGSKTSSASKSLVIRSMEMHDIIGDVHDNQTFVGRGSLDFVNPSRKNSQNTIFAIPSDIIARIGLDLDVLNPVVGTILFDLHDGKVWLNEFRDVYSEGRVSRFYLPSNTHKSYVDFDGGLNVRVRMKQYNLIFKLAELFTVSIQGTLSKPIYSIQKRSAAGSEGSTEVVDDFDLKESLDGEGKG